MSSTPRRSIDARTSLPYSGPLVNVNHAELDALHALLAQSAGADLAPLLERVRTALASSPMWRLPS